MDRLKDTIEAIKPVDRSWFGKAQVRLDSLTKPPGSLGRLEEFAARLVAITESEAPVIDKKVIFTFAGDHGVVDEGVAAYPREVTAQMVFNFLNGGAGINVLSKHAGSDVVVVDMGVDYDFGNVAGLVDCKVMRGTKNMAKGPAMTRDEAIKCIEAGIGLAESWVAKGYAMFGTGDMGIGNTTPSSAIVAAITGTPAAEVTGRGTGISDEALTRKTKVIEAAIRLNAPDAGDGLDVLAKVGGTEIGGIAGLVLGAAAHRKPVVIDGLISTAGALIACTIAPAAKDYIFAAHIRSRKGIGSCSKPWASLRSSISP